MIRNLQRRNARRRESDVVLEGVRLVEEALRAAVPIHAAVMSAELETTERGSALLAGLAAAGVIPDVIDPAELAGLADTETPQGILAVATPPVRELADISPGPRAPVLVLDGVQDPGNAGALIRTALALHAAGVLLLPGSAHQSHPKVLRSSMGAIFRLPVVRVGDDEFDGWLRLRGVELVALVAKAGRPGNPTGRPLAVMVGNEGAGIRAEWLARADRQWSIKMAPGAESLNVAVAAGIILYEVQRAS